MENSGSKFPLGMASIILFLLVIIILLSLYLFNIITLPSFFSKQTTSPTTVTTGSSIPTDMPMKQATIQTMIDPAKPMTFTNDTNQSVLKPIPNNVIDVTSDIEIQATVLIKFDQDAPPDASTGLFFSNGVSPEKDPYLRLFYYLQNQRWSLGFKNPNSTNVVYTGITGTPKDDIFGTFTIAIAADGKSATITPPNQTSKSVPFPNSLYQFSRKMVLKAQVGPKSTMTISSLKYKSAP